jgi:hypothetical protein
LFWSAWVSGEPCNDAHRDTGEAIEVLALPLKDTQSFMEDADLAKSAGLLYGLLWLRSAKALHA